MDLTETMYKVNGQLVHLTHLYFSRNTLMLHMQYGSSSTHQTHSAKKIS